MAQTALDASVEHANIPVLKIVLRHLTSNNKIDVRQLVGLREDNHDPSVSDCLEKQIARVTLKNSGMLAALFSSNGIHCCYQQAVR